MSLPIKPALSCTYDQISLGEVMLRLDPGEGRIRTTRAFKVWEGGGEYNTSRGLRKCFSYKTAVCTAFVDNEVGHLVEDFIMQGGVATEFIKWREDDGIGRTVRPRVACAIFASWPLRAASSTTIFVKVWRPRPKTVPLVSSRTARPSMNHAGCSASGNRNGARPKIRRPNRYAPPACSRCTMWVSSCVTTIRSQDSVGPESAPSNDAVRISTRG